MPGETPLTPEEERDLRRQVADESEDWRYPAKSGRVTVRRLLATLDAERARQADPVGPLAAAHRDLDYYWCHRHGLDTRLPADHDLHEEACRHFRQADPVGLLRHGLEVLHSPHFGWGCTAATCSGQAALDYLASLPAQPVEPCTCGVTVRGGTGIWQPKADCPVHGSAQPVEPDYWRDAYMRLATEVREAQPVEPSRRAVYKQDEVGGRAYLAGHVSAQPVEPGPLDVERLAQAWWKCVNEPEEGPWADASDTDIDNANGWAMALAAEYARLGEDGRD